MCKLMFAQNKYTKRLLLLFISSFLFVQNFSSFATAADKWVVSEASQLNKEQGNASPQTAATPPVIVETSGIENGIQVYNFNSRRLVTAVAKTTDFNVVGRNKNWVYVTISGYPVWVHTNYIEREQGQVRVVIQEGTLNLRKEPNKYAMTLGTAENGYYAGELDYKDPWVKIVAPEGLKFAIKEVDFNNLKQGQGSVSGTDINKQTNKDDNNRARFETKSSDNSVQKQTVSESIVSGSSVAVKTVAPKSKPIAVRNNKIPYTDGLIYRLTPGDVISIQVYGEQELSVNQIRIPESGVISFPLIGQIKIAGKTAVAIENLVTRKLANGYIRNPKISLVIDNYRPIYIRGAVSKSGAFPFTEDLTIAKAITLAGGVTKAANFEGVSLIRKNLAVDGQLSIDSQILVQPGDIISISEKYGGASENAIEFIYLHGEVRSPGGYDFRKGLTVEKAVALAGGFSARASKRRVNISRQVPGQEEPLQIKKVDLYFAIQPGDVISVGASWF